MRKFIVIAGAALSSIALVALVAGRRWFSSWGIAPIEGELTLPGDDLVPEPTMSDTRGLTIDAPPSAVWPWLAQLGFGRGGWYSYDAMDMKGRSAEMILPEHQALAVGDIVPTDPDGGFEVKVLEPERALVLLVDNAIVARRPEQARIGAVSSPGLAASGRFMQVSMPPEFAVSWAIVLQPLDGGRTRLIERVRAAYGATSRGTRAFGPMLGFGVFLMTRRQMLGIAERAQRYAADPLASLAASPATTPVDPSAGHEAAPARELSTKARRRSRAIATPPPGGLDEGASNDVVPMLATREGPAPANGHATDLEDAAPAP